MKLDYAWKRPVLRPLPEDSQSILSLNGAWEYAPEAPAAFAGAPFESADWRETAIPCQMSVNQRPYAYRKIVDIPEKWRGSRLFLRFDGANCVCDVYINGVFAKSHYGGFVSWEVEISDLASAGVKCEIALRMEDRPREVNSFHFGGLIRDVTLYALPRRHVSRLHVETEFDSDFENARLKIDFSAEGGGEIAFSLISPDGFERALGAAECADKRDETREYIIESPKKWDAEHPNLYTLRAKLGSETVVKKFGFRQILIEGREMFINGRRVKLRGVNRHDVHPLSGRAITRELCEEDVRLFKEANVNFIRTSHYPPRPDFLDLCDEYGMYVEDETSVAFLGYGVDSTENDPSKTACFMGPFADMIERDRSHPSVIIWSLANESHWGDNIEKMNAYAHETDRSRPTIFSFPFTQPDDAPFTDIWSVHYGKWDTDLSALRDAHGRSLPEEHICPVLHDESTHIPCYDYDELARDPGLRDFWGETICRFWDRIWRTDGALGCAIWAGIDDSRAVGGALKGPEWGLIDGWRRKKPEWWHTRKAFSPVYICGKARKGAAGIEICVENRFNHSNMDEITARYKMGDSEGEMRCPSIAPNESGVITLPTEWREGERLEVGFFDGQGYIVQEICEILGEEKAALPTLSGKAPELKRAADGGCEVSGDGFSLKFCGETGLITCGRARGKTVLTGGPHLQLTGLDLGAWQLISFDARINGNAAEITVDGAYDDVRVEFSLKIDDSGLIDTTADIKDIPYSSPRKVAISPSICSHAGGYSEVGIAFDVEGGLDELVWQKRGLWDAFPVSHIGRLSGEALKHNPRGKNAPQSKPDWEWRDDEVDRASWGDLLPVGLGTNDFRSMKTRVIRAGLRGSGAAFTVMSDGRHAVRAESIQPAENIRLNTDRRILYDGGWTIVPNKNHTPSASGTYSDRAGDKCAIVFYGTGIEWYASLDKIGGKARATVDGSNAEIIDLGISNRKKNPRCYLRSFDRLVYRAKDLPLGEHVIEITVLGENGEDSNAAYVNVNRFRIIDTNPRSDTRLIINGQYNYPTLSWADYENPPVFVKNGYTARALTKISTDERNKHRRNEQ